MPYALIAPFVHALVRGRMGRFVLEPMRVAGERES
jgi:hypothetical protein